ncbi:MULTISPECIES: branched-chain amino acid ABC transporter permease [Rhizobium/Agrobacterium group]|uniref:branched-chain amino acid ABC transporter permease n=1 Tax=Rhizobium/Agrobacterium group TaxID=227290 RepID=UPI0022B85160|nr:MULTISPECIES: branched-chain amino acid ABC transporter permease [Rhizobium/Agrobacterium group]MCZ7889966.1 branched-chain amino acid ABC transporter permease [Agrobacterium salinitolerans]MDA5636467.1 branched-chain amino acid ABC transporter permease [Agrobacterium sp. ST15.16.024]MDF1892317.1 branched-chain amino acid ABC transporter permease [Rhizobium rhizogenes]
MGELAHSIVAVLFYGLSFGAVLYLISVGLSVTMGVMNFANLAHGVFAMAGGYLTVSLMNFEGLPFISSLIVGALGSAVLGLLLERTLFRLLYRASELRQVLFSIGIVFMATALSRMIWGVLPQPFNLPNWLSGDVSVFGQSLQTFRLILIIVGFGVAGFLWLLLGYSSYGARVRAAVDHRSMAECIGINTERLFAITFMVGCGLAGLGGGLGAATLAIHPGYAMENLVLFLIVVSVGGAKSTGGPFLAAMMLGTLDAACKYFVPEIGAFAIYVAMFALLAWRPQGLFGRA